MTRRKQPEKGLKGTRHKLSDFYQEPMQHRPIPSMARDFRSVRSNVYDTPCRSSTHSRFLEAYELIDAIDVSKRGTTKERIDINELTCDDVHIDNCIRYIRAMTMTDHRVVVNGAVVMSMPAPDITIVKLHPLTGNKTQLVNVRAKECVVLLAEALSQGSTAPSLYILRELYVHASNRIDDWEAIDGMSEKELKFAIATAGVKAARKLYRHKDMRQLHPYAPKLETRLLMESMEIWAKQQVKLCPDHPLGYWNLGWLAMESAVKGKVHGLTAAANCLGFMKQCYERAQDDDFLRANARIEAALCLSVGASGWVGYSSGRGPTVKRYFADPFHAEWGAMVVKTVQEQMTVVAKEQNRIDQGVPSTKIEPDESVVVERWEVLKLWNEAMVAFDALKEWGHEFYVYGETRGWDSVVSLLVQTTHLGPSQWATALNNDEGFPSVRDMGQSHSSGHKCAMCGEWGKDHKQCGRCKSVTYCSRTCQVADWKAGHKKLCKELTSGEKIMSDYI